MFGFNITDGFLHLLDLLLALFSHFSCLLLVLCYIFLLLAEFAHMLHKSVDNNLVHFITGDCGVIHTVVE